MIQLEKVNKYYNKGKPNRIHVINDTSMTLPDKGIVCLLGSSGSGKTTLLNAIGGLDSIDTGRISIDGKIISGKNSVKIDEIRNAHIGYVFQEFYLLDDRTVFDNVAIALNMVGVKDEDVVRERVYYCLRKVGMYRFRNRKASALSGGQRQRVAIARAIVKAPSIIIADEPSGNLDSTNTVEVMNIIRKLGDERLVILVTHDRDLATFYADHIAEISDGKIVDSYNNDSSRFLDYHPDNRIYLKDMPNIADLESDGASIRIYSDTEIPEGIRLVISNGNIYIDSGGRLNVADDDGSIELVDDHYHLLDRSDMEENDFDFAAHLPDDFSPEYTPVYDFGNMLKTGFRNVRSFSRVRKFLMLGFLFAAMFTFLAIGNIAGILDVPPEEYLISNDRYVTVHDSAKTEGTMDIVESLDAVDFVLPGDSMIDVSFVLDDYLQTSHVITDLRASTADAAILKEKDIVCGKLPATEREIVVDRMLVNEMLVDGITSQIGITDEEQFIGRKMKAPNLDFYVVSGISDTGSPSIYADESQLMYLITNADTLDMGSWDIDDSEDNLIRNGTVRDIALAGEDFKITKGSKPAKLNETAVNESCASIYPIGSELDVKMSGKPLKVSGYYHSSEYGSNVCYVTEATVRKDFISKQDSFIACTEDPTALQALLEHEDLVASVNSENEKMRYKTAMRGSVNSSLLVSCIILLISLIEMFLMQRSSFMSRIREVGTMRAIGLKKRDIHTMFAGEILAITLLTAIPGIMIMYAVMTKVTAFTSLIGTMYVVSPLIALITFAVLVLFNTIAGIIPVLTTMRKTPAQILSRSDIN